MERRDWMTLRAALFLAGLAAWPVAAILALRGMPWEAAAFAVLAIGAHEIGRAWSRMSPVPMPHVLKWVLLLPRGPHSPKSLAKLLRLRAGERVLEIGPGVGVHALPFAPLLLPGGSLEALDVQAAMLEELGRRAAARGVANVTPRLGDARELPYADATFDAVYLIGVLGEIPGHEAALREVRRVLKPEGRLLIAEVFVDPDFVNVGRLREKAARAGLGVERVTGPRLMYSALLRPARG